MFAASNTIKTVTPISSAMTPTLLIRAISRTPTELITVVSPISRQPSKTAFLALSDRSAASPIN